MKLSYPKYLLILMLFTTYFSGAQVGINTTTPQALLDIKVNNSATPSNTDGLLVPRIDAFPATNPTATQQGMLVYLTTNVGLQSKGFYYWDNPTATWKSLTEANPGWDLNGNSGTTSGTNFIGTTDNQALDIRTDNTVKVRITTKGQIEVLNTGQSVFIGEDAGLVDDLTANQNVFIGTSAGKSNTTGENNTFIGQQSGEANTTGINNVGVGKLTLNRATTGEDNVALGRYSLLFLTTGRDNVSVGTDAGARITTGEENVIMGDGAFYNNTTGSKNVVLGSESMLLSTTGNSNIAIGSRAGYHNSTGSRNIYIGNDAGYNDNGNDRLYIDNTITATPLIYGDFASNLLRINGTLNINNAYNLPSTTGLANQFLQTDGSGNTTWVNSPVVAETDPQVSSATINYIPKWNGTTLVDGQIYDNGTNVGVGANNPNALLTVGTTITPLPFNPKLSVNTTGNSPLFVGETTGVKGLILGYDGNNIQGRSGVNFSANSDLILNNYGGKVGIGTSTPTTHMHIASDNSITNTTLESGNQQYPVALSILPSTHATSERSAIKLDDWQILQDVTGTGAKDFTIYQGSTASQRITIGTNGNVGIGINAPTEKLDINGKTKTTAIQVTNGATSGYVLQSDATGNGTWVNPTSLSVTEADPQVSSSTPNYMPKWNGTSLIDGQVYDDGANVGIGTTVPRQKLHVNNGNALFSGFYTGVATNPTGVQITPMPSNSNAGGSIFFREETDNLWGFTIGYNGGNDNGILNWKANTFNIAGHNNDATGASYFTIERLTGNIGIGTSAPASKLEVNGNTSTTNFQMTNGATNGYVLQSNASGNGTWVNPTSLTVTETDPQVSSAITNYIPKWNGTTLVDGQVFDNGTNVGIGTATPTEKLHLFGGNILADRGSATTATTRTLALGGARSGSGSSFAQIDFKNYDSNNSAADYIGASIQSQNTQSTDDGDLRFFTNDGNLTERMNITNAGNVGIGTSTPTQAKLVVNGLNSNTFTSYGFLSRTNVGNSASSVTADYSIYASDRIAASEFNAFSDARIKNIKGITNSKQDLETLSKIEITNYTLKDTLSKGNTSYKKVIAQQVEKVYPQAVSKLTDVVPDIYRQAEIFNGFISLENDLKAGEKIKIITQSGDQIVAVLEASSKGFKINSNQSGKVFVYGRQVNDFRSVDYEALSTLNISATQELLKRIETLEKENAALKTQLNSIGQLKAEIDSIKKDIYTHNILLTKN